MVFPAAIHLPAGVGRLLIGFGILDTRAAGAGSPLYQLTLCLYGRMPSLIDDRLVRNQARPPIILPLRQLAASPAPLDPLCGRSPSNLDFLV